MLSTAEVSHLSLNLTPLNLLNRLSTCFPLWNWRYWWQ